MLDSSARRDASPAPIDRLLERFLRYVSVETTANDRVTEYPSSEGQWRLGRMLVEEFQAMGIDQVEQDRWGVVYAELSSSVGPDRPIVAFNAHLDTSPEMSGANIRPQIIRGYRGGDLRLPGAEHAVIRVDDNRELEQLVGCTLITTDGTTLLGADDKAGVAILMELAQRLLEHPEIPRGPLRIVFTCDEEIGRGIQHIDLERLGATVAYTLDGPAAGHIDTETFSADLATIVFRGNNIHPAIARGRMVNAVKAASAFVASLPAHELSPETTSGRQGFVHPYSLEAGVAQATLKVLLRDFDTPRLRQHESLLRERLTDVRREFPGIEVDFRVTPQYRNLAEGLAREPRAVMLAEEAFRRLGRPCQRSVIRGGTDGSQLTERGLPTPNLSSGQHNPHSHLEWACLEEMEGAVEMLLELVRVWSEAT